MECAVGSLNSDRKSLVYLNLSRLSQKEVVAFWRGAVVTFAFAPCVFPLRAAHLPRGYLESNMAHEHEVHVYNVKTSLRYDLQYGNLDLVDDGLTIAGILGGIARPPGRRSQQSGIERAPWTLDDTHPARFQDLFRFEDAGDVRHLMRVMEFPDTWEVPEGKFTAEEAMSLFLRRMAYPCRFVELQGEMRAQRSALSSLFLAVTEWMYDKWTLPLLNSGMTKWRHRAQMYADAIDWRTGVDWGNVIGFVDGTARRITKPSVEPDEVYDGHHKQHALSYLGIIGPDGMILWSAEPESGRRNDNFLVNVNNLIRRNGLAYDSVMERLHRATGKLFQYYGDSAFANTRYSQSAYARSIATRQELRYNKLMNSARVSVEHVFGHVVSKSAWVDYYKNQKLLLQPVGKHYLNAQLLANCCTCLYGNQVSQGFDVRPPTLEEYFAMEEMELPVV